MTDRPQSKLPQEPEYWDELAAKINDDATGPLASYAATPDDWTAVLGRQAPWLVAASAAAMLVLWLTLPARPPSMAFRWIESSLIPSEVAGTLVAGSAPPSVETLMVQFPPSEEEQR
jgi:hypothetical protein